MGSENYPLRNIGIYRNLPTFDPTIQNLTAIITGANGISGFSTLRALLDSPERWTKIFALSRRPPPEGMLSLLTESQRSRVQHIPVDFLSSPEAIASTLTDHNVTATHVFFYSYAQPKAPPGQPMWSNADELLQVNTALLTNFLSALTKANIRPQRILLQTGAKNYGVHLGRTRQPAIETDPQPTHLAPNFYYPQEAALFSHCEAQNTEWNVIMPAWIVGAVNNASMNGLHPYAVYAAVQAHRNKPLLFPGDWAAWQGILHVSNARLTGYLSEWAILESKCANQRFNSVDTSPFVVERFYEALTRWFDVARGWEAPSPDATAYRERVGPSGRDAPLGYGPPLTWRASFSFVQWASEPENHAAWRRIMADSAGKVTDDPFEDPEGLFACADALWISMVLSMDRARKLGWTGFVDSVEGVFEMYRDMAVLGMLPEMKVKEAR